MKRTLLLVCAVACTEYEFGSVGDGKAGDDTAILDSGEPTPPPDDDDCPPPDVAEIGVPVDESCEEVPEVGTFTPVLEWAQLTSQSAYTTPVIGQLTDDNGDGLIDDSDTPDVVVTGTSGGLFVVSGDGSGTHWTANGLGSEPSTPAIADLDGDGRPEVIASGNVGFRAYRGEDGDPYWNNSTSTTQNICGGVAVYDLDGDGLPEVVQGKTVVNGQTGATRWNGAHGAGTGYTSGYYASFGVAADIDVDGDLEVVVGNALYDADGNTIWYNGQSDGFVAVGNFDNDDNGEIVVTTYPGMVRLQDDDGTVLWSGSYTGNTIGPPTVADFDNDGEAEIGVAGNGVYVVLDTDGTQLWSRSINDYSSGFTGSAVFDFEGDGEAEVVFADEQDVWVFDGATGAVKLQESTHSSATCSEYPAIADVDGDGEAEIVYTSSAYGSGAVAGVRAIGDADSSWRPARSVWNQHSYDITNVEDSVGTLPTTPNPNWLTYNNFRSGDLTAATGGVYADALPALGDVCTIDCDEGRLEVVVFIGNGGVSSLPVGVPVSLYAKSGPTGYTLLETRYTSAEILSGESEAGMLFLLDPADVPDGELKFVVDDDGFGSELVAECDEDNNELIIIARCD